MSNEAPRLMNAPADGVCRVVELRPWLGAALIVAAVVLAWGNSMSGPFTLDDASSIEANESIRDLASFRWLAPPSALGETVSGRPVLNLSFAINYAIGGFDVRGYHITNVAIHLLAALTLFGVVRRTLLCPTVTEHFRIAASSIALAVATLWAVHPLQTEAVTYIVQRAESLMTLFYLLTLYGFLRATQNCPSGVVLESPSVRVRGKAESRRQSPVQATAASYRSWFVFAWCACLLGMGTKENMVSAPVIVLLLDQAFVAGSFAAAWRTRRRFYVALGSTWALLGVLLLSTGGNRGGTAGFDIGASWLTHILTQCSALMRYVGLSFWPHPLVFDYGPFFAAHAGGVAWPAVLVVLLLVTGTVYALWRHAKIGIPGAIAFALLAPTSLVPGTLQIIVEHRMYLPLAAVIVLVCLGCDVLVRPRARWLLPVLAVLSAVVLGGMTFARNQVYQSEITLWQDTVDKVPNNPRAHNNLGIALANAGRTEEAQAHYRQAISLQPNHAFAHCNLGNSLVAQRRWAEAEIHYNAALAADPHYVNARVNLGQALMQLGRNSEAVVQFRAALADDNGAQDARTNLAALFIADGQIDEAVMLLREVLLASPELAEAHYHLGCALEKQGQLAGAEIELRAAVRLKPELATGHLALGNLATRSADMATAEACFRQAIRLDTNLAEARFALGNVQAQQQQFDAAMATYRQALVIDPSHLQARNNLANCQLVTGKLSDAIANYEEVLRMRPRDESVRQNLEIARELRRAEAK